MIVVTGATGHVGSALVRQLAARGQEVRAFIRDPAKADRFPAGADIAVGNLEDFSALLKACQGADRMFLLVMSEAYEEQDLSTSEKQDSRVVLKLNPKLAPIKLAVLPLTKKDGLPEIANDIMDQCRSSFRCFYEEKDSIGKRYRRMDALGTPFCVTVDHQSKEDNAVTIRYRDSMEQERIPISEIRGKVLSSL